jgi:hypothetical protein
MGSFGAKFIWATRRDDNTIAEEACESGCSPTQHDPLQIGYDKLPVRLSFAAADYPWLSSPLLLCRRCMMLLTSQRLSLLSNVPSHGDMKPGQWLI